MSELFTPEEIEKARLFLELFSANGLTQLEITEPDGFAFAITKTSPMIAQVPQQLVPPTVITTSPPPVAARKTKIVSKVARPSLNSPMVGIFYTSPSPGDPPFIAVGDTVKIGQTIGLIEAMKVFSEIPAESAGRIVEVAALTGTLVQQSQPLFIIEPI